MLTPISVEGKEIRCQHADTWPPGWARLGKTVSELRAYFTTEEYERAKTWEKVCGLRVMNAEKCPTCPHAVLPDALPPKSVLSVKLHSKNHPSRKHR